MQSVFKFTLSDELKEISMTHNFLAIKHTEDFEIVFNEIGKPESAFYPQDVVKKNIEEGHWIIVD